jgi:glycerol-3-phosphate O-acyltransferase
MPLIRRRARTATQVADELVASERFRAGAAELAATLDRSAEDVLLEARACVGELATEQQPVAVKLWARWARFVWGRAYRLEVDEAHLDRLRALGGERPLVFLPSHKSNLDGYVMAAMLHEHGFPPNHVLGGINMAFWPLGPVGRRVGVIWIRRSFAGDEVYKLALRRYLAHLASERLPLEWYIEGGRSRTGKLLPPKMGLLSYLARGVEEAGLEEVMLVPVSIVYDRLAEVVEMTAESRGARKQPEGMRWLLRYAYAQRSRLGRVRVRFGEPVGLVDSLAVGDDGDRSLALNKTAFEVCTRINRATPVTSTSLATLALLGSDGWAVNLDQAIALVQPLRDYVRKRDLPGCADTDELETRAGMRRVLGDLIESGVVDAFANGAQEVYRISPERELAAAFYRNVIIHWFVNRAIVELGLVVAAESGEEDRTQVALDEAFRLRDLLKFEFFFAEKAQFQRELRAELELISPQWQADGGAVLQTLAASIAASGGLVADRILRSFLEAYWVVADRLVDHGGTMVDADELVTSCLGVGQQYLLQRRIVSGEAISVELFRTALKLAANRGLLDPDNPVRAEGRVALAAELHEALRRLELLNRWEEGHRRRREGDQPRATVSGSVDRVVT